MESAVGTIEKLESFSNLNISQLHVYDQVEKLESSYELITSKTYQLNHLSNYVSFQLYVSP